MTRIPKRGPVTVKKGGLTFRLWWSPEWRSWGVARYDEDDNQLDGGALWSATRDEAVGILREALGE